jgi:hypothetical protein
MQECTGKFWPEGAANFFVPAAKLCSTAWRYISACVITPRYMSLHRNLRPDEQPLFDE